MHPPAPATVSRRHRRPRPDAAATRPAGLDIWPQPGLAAGPRRLRRADSSYSRCLAACWAPHCGGRRCSASATSSWVRWCSASCTAPRTVGRPLSNGVGIGGDPGAAGGAQPAGGGVARGSVHHGGLVGRLVHAGRRAHVDRGVRRRRSCRGCCRRGSRVGSAFGTSSRFRGMCQLGPGRAVVGDHRVLVSVFGGLFAGADPAFANLVGTWCLIDVDDIVARLWSRTSWCAFVAGRPAI